MQCCLSVILIYISLDVHLDFFFYEEPVQVFVYFPIGVTICLKSFYVFIDIGEVREKKRERNINVWLPLACPPLRTWPTQAYVLAGNRTGNPLVRRPALNPLRHTSQGGLFFSI